MSGRWQTVRLRAIRSAQGVNGAALLAMVLALFMILSTGATHACPGMAAGAATVTHEVKSAAVVTATVSIPKAEVASGGGTAAQVRSTRMAPAVPRLLRILPAAVVGSAAVVVFPDVVADHALRRERHLARAIRIAISGPLDPWPELPPRRKARAHSSSAALVSRLLGRRIPAPEKPPGNLHD
jgi:cobalamin synthase